MKKAKIFTGAILGATMLLLASSNGADASSESHADWKLPPETAKLRPGPNSQMVTGTCLMCHSADYLSSQPPMTRKAWEATVVKMKEKYGAPLQQSQIEPIVNYLAEAYGKK
jgi:hypothetical protein